MSFTTENASEMARKRGRPPKAETQEAQRSEPTPQPNEPMVSVILLRGWWPVDGTKYSVMDEHGQWGEEQVYETPVDVRTGEVDEMARKRLKLGPDTRVVVPYGLGKHLVNSGKALNDRTM